MSKKIVLSLVILTLLVIPAAAPAAFPEKEVQIIVPYAAGGATDLIFRALAESTSRYLGKAVVIVNRPGGGGTVGFTEGAQAKPDGYTLTAVITPVTILPHQVKTAFTYRSFAPIINVVDDPSMFLVKADSPWKTTKEFVDYARKNPGMITVGNSGAGGGVHLVALAFEKAVGARFNHIPFAGGGPSVTALMGGHINAVSVSPPRRDSPGQGGQAEDHRALRRRALRAVPQCADGQGAGHPLLHGHVARPGGAEGNPGGRRQDAARRLQERHGGPRVQEERP